MGELAMHHPAERKAERKAENLDRRFWQVLIVVRRARSSQTLQEPGLRVTSFDVQLWFDSCQVAETLKLLVRTRVATAKKMAGPDRIRRASGP